MLRLSVLFVCLALPATAAPLSGVKTAQLSAELYAAATEADDPLLLIAAAKLRKSVVFRGKGQAPLGWEAMLARAEDLAAGDDVLLGLIGDVRAEASKGVAAGPVYRIGDLASGGVETFTGIGFAAGDYAEVYVEAQAQSDMNLQVFDGTGQVVCADTDPSPVAYCGWTTLQGGNFILQVDNLGPQDTGYALMTN